MKKAITIVFVALFLSAAISAQSTEFTYQGRLLDNSLPPTANYDLQFRLWDSETGGGGFGVETRLNVPVSRGIFTVVLDFDDTFRLITDGWLEIRIRPAGSPDPFLTLTGRQRITSTPYAIKSLNSETAETSTNSTQLGGVPAANYLQRNGDGSGLTNLNGGSIAAGTVTSTQLSPEAVPNTTAYKLLGSLRWDLLKPQATFAVRTGPVAVAFDGANIWVANSVSNNVSKLRASDGAELGTFAVGSVPRGVAFDGANIWVANAGGDNVRKLRASDGANLGTFAVGTNPRAIAFDGANIWVANTASNNVTKLRASDGANLGTFAVGTAPRGLAFDGMWIWVANSGSNTLTILRASDGSTIINGVVTGATPTALAFDGAHMWLANSGGNTVTKLNPSDPELPLGTFIVGNNPQGIAFDGVNIWVTTLNAVTKMRASDGVRLRSFFPGTNPGGIAFDGANIWVANSSSNNVTRLVPAFPEP